MLMFVQGLERCFPSCPACVEPGSDRDPYPFVHSNPKEVGAPRKAGAAAEKTNPSHPKRNMG